jgi:hypothetical protein
MFFRHVSAPGNNVSLAASLILSPRNLQESLLEQASVDFLPHIADKWLDAPFGGRDRPVGAAFALLTGDQPALAEETL